MLLSARFLNTPLFLEGRRAPALLEGLLCIGAEYDPPLIAKANRSQPRQYELINGVAVIEIRGILVHTPGWGWDEVEYGWIGHCIEAAVADDEARCIVLHVNSPGGEVAGCFDLANRIFALRGVKPIWAILDECAFSAAYALASAADFVTVPRTGGTGSIGVIALRLDIVEALEMAGVKLTTLVHGLRKTDTYPNVALSGEVRDRLQADIDNLVE